MVSWLLEDGFFNKSLMTNRRKANPLEGDVKIGHITHTPSLLPPAVAYLNC